MRGYGIRSVVKLNVHVTGVRVFRASIFGLSRFKWRLIVCALCRPGTKDANEMSARWCQGLSAEDAEIPYLVIIRTSRSYCSAYRQSSGRSPHVTRHFKKWVDSRYIAGASWQLDRVSSTHAQRVHCAWALQYLDYVYGCSFTARPYNRIETVQVSPCDLLSVSNFLNISQLLVRVGQICK